ncbi:MAG: DUF4040 domain-containing protein [Alphaproteobacteria bacterium]
MELFVNITLFTFLLVTALMIIRLRDLFAVVMLSGVFSLLSAGLFVALDAVDVAFTEAAVGAGITTVLFLGALRLTGAVEKPPRESQFVPLAVMTGLAAILIYGTMDMPPFGLAAAPIHLHVAPQYISGAETQIGIPNVVSAVLASYRGFDTLGETGVIFTAGIGVILLLRAGRHTRRQHKGDAA